jgi:hypothetical protein
MRKFRPVLEVVILSVIAYALHKIIFHFLGMQPTASQFQYPLEKVYGFFLLCSITIVLTSIFVRQKNIDNVGNIFLLLTIVKMGIAYAVVYPVMQSAAPDAYTEKMNFFMVFGVFLAIETITSIRILNKA